MKKILLQVGQNVIFCFFFNQNLDEADRKLFYLYSLCCIQLYPLSLMLMYALVPVPTYVQGWAAKSIHIHNMDMFTFRSPTLFCYCIIVKVSVMWHINSERDVNDPFLNVLSHIRKLYLVTLWIYFHNPKTHNILVCFIRAYPLEWFGLGWTIVQYTPKSL